MRQVADHPCQGTGSRPQRSLPTQTLGRTFRHWSPPGRLHPTDPGNQDVRLVHQGQGAAPTAAARGSSAPWAPSPSSPFAPPPSPGPTTSTNETGTKRVGPSCPRPDPPPIDSPHWSTPPRAQQRVSKIRTCFAHHRGEKTQLRNRPRSRQTTAVYYRPYS